MKTRTDRQRARAIRIIEGMNREQVEDALTILIYVQQLTKEEFKEFRAISKSKGFCGKLFARRLRESIAV